MSTAPTLTMPDGRTVGYADFGPAEGTPVIWCHGGPGSRLEPTQVAAEAAAAGFRDDRRRPPRIRPVIAAARSFDATAVRVPTIVLHGREDSIVDVAQATHTASLVPGARLKIVDGLAHLSIVTKVPETLAEL